MLQRIALAAMLSSLALAGCLSDTESTENSTPEPTILDAPFLGYIPDEPDESLALIMEDYYYQGSDDDVVLHVRVTRPAGDGPYPVVVQDTPYTGEGCNTESYNQAYGNSVEPPVWSRSGTCGEGTFEYQFARRGYAYAHGDLRGTGDSTGCLNLRGQADIDDIGMVADALAAEPWSNGNVGFIGASYPGSTSHMAALSGSDAVKAVVPVVASTSFYHYHHNDGVPYSNHGIGSTNTGYTSEGFTPTVNPQSGISKLVNQPNCPHTENAFEHGGADQTGAYYEWWQERNLRPKAVTIDTPVLMAQGLADWNVKPDHVAHWFNDLPGTEGGAPKVFIGGQWGHAYPRSQTDDDRCEGKDYGTHTEPGSTPGTISSYFCDNDVPYGQWWEYAAAFFDTYLKEIDTGMFQEDVAWVQASDGSWHRSSEWPLQGENAGEVVFNLAEDGTMSADQTGAFEASWYACGAGADAAGNSGASSSQNQANAAAECDEQPEPLFLRFTTPAFTENTTLSGVPLLQFNVDTGGVMRHLTVVMSELDAEGNVVTSRENYGYLNPEFRNGLENQEPVPEGAYPVTIDFYPQEDVIPAGHSLRITISSTDGGRTIAAFDSGVATMVSDAANPAQLILPTRPADLHGVRLAEPTETDEGSAE